MDEVGEYVGRGIDGDQVGDGVSCVDGGIDEEGCMDIVGLRLGGSDNDGSSLTEGAADGVEVNGMEKMVVTLSGPEAHTSDLSETTSP